MRSFHEFVDKKTRESKKHLQTIKKLLGKHGLEVKDFLEGEEPYIYLKNPGDSLPFDGVRIYQIGGEVAYRVQNEEKTHPYGKAYPLSVDEMYQDLISDEHMNERKAGEEVIKAVAAEFRHFFAKSTEAEKDNRSEELDRQRDPTGRMSLASTTGTDYASTLQNQRTNSPL